MQQNTLIAFFDEKTNRYYRLFSTNDFPCLEISGIRMHCIDTGVKATATAMVESLLPLRGKILDCCTGLGYTAILLAKQPKTEKVYCFEKDPNVLKIAKQNQFSAKLFSNKKIILENKDIISVIKEFPENFFNAILHDPPRISIAGELYSNEFYAELFRVLKHQGKLFHYTGNPGEKKGLDFPTKVQERLEKIGFKNTSFSEKANGLIAQK